VLLQLGVNGQCITRLTLGEEFLGARGLDVPQDARARITGCTDLDQLTIRVRRAVTATSVHELFD